ncbi:Protein BZZ1, partial [Massospora cicadina]
RFNFAEKLTQEINVFLKSLVFRTEEACKKAFNVNKRLVDEKQGVLEDMNKINRQCFHEVIDRNNNKAQAQLRELDTNIAVKRNELEGLGNLCSAYLENPALGDLNEIREHMFEVWRDLAFLDNSHLGFQTEANLILASVGDLPTGQIHDFKAASFTIPTTCDYCENTIWGLSRHGASCKECGYNCHAKCELKAPLNCASAKGGSKADRRPPADLSTLAAKTAHFLKANVRSPLPASFLEPKPKSEPITAVALYDYDKTDDAELTIRENQIVEILVADDGSGWVTARLNGNTGLVPAAYISTSDIASTGIMAQAIYDFDAQAETDLSIRAGELIEVTNQNVAEGWWEGKLNGRIGQFPADYVKIV